MNERREIWKKGDRDIVRENPIKRRIKEDENTGQERRRERKVEINKINKRREIWKKSDGDKVRENQVEKRMKGEMKIHDGKGGGRSKWRWRSYIKKRNMKEWEWWRKRNPLIDEEEDQREGNQLTKSSCQRRKCFDLARWRRAAQNVDLAKKSKIYKRKKEVSDITFRSLTDCVSDKEYCRGW